jgi:hypothetical protein
MAAMLPGCASWCKWNPRAWFASRSLAIPETYPLGSVVRAHYHAMETNAEASDFILHRVEFVGSTAELTSEGKDHLLEILARLADSPFPVVIERSENNSDPELDEHRRQMVAAIVSDFGFPDVAANRVVTAPAYEKGLNSHEGESDYYRFIGSRRGSEFGGGQNSGSFGGLSLGGSAGGFGGGFGF